MKHRTIIVLGLLLAAAGCQTTQEDTDRANVPEIRPGVLAGYLAPAALPNAVAFIPPPPAPNSPTLAADIAANEQALAMSGSARFRQAARDADLEFPAAATRFQCELGTVVSEAGTPVLYRLLRRSMVDAGIATYSAKNAYERERPFLVNGEPTCTPETVSELAEDGSYPSGHASIGWAWALILSGLAPARSAGILARGWAFGQSRAICNVHWQSDVDAGRLVGAAVVARLHVDPVFRADFADAAEELVSVRERGLAPVVECP